jgi:N6-L-threonylcarbamoyladenine synthase
MRILAIETSCDETSAAVVEKKDNIIQVLSHTTATSIALHATTGGIIPENAAREQVKMILPVIADALLKFKKIQTIEDTKKNWENANEILKNEIDALAITHGPGLIGSLLVGVETAKTLSYVFQKPIIPINHLLGHIFANFIGNNKIQFPFIGLIVSGGHTDLLFFKNTTEYEWLGGTRDDAAGEALDKIGRLLNLPYPAGPEIEKRAKNITNPKISFTSPMIYDEGFDFSFSGLKAEVMRFVQKNKALNEEQKNEICFAVQKAIIDVLVKKTLAAAKKYNVQTILLGGGVSANQKLHEEFKNKINELKLNVQVLSPEKQYTTDNAAMIGAYALLDYQPVDWSKIHAIPDLYFKQ